MKTLEVSNYGVQEMNAMEMGKVDGGIGLIAGIIISIVIAELLDRGAPQDFKDGWDAAKKRNK